MILAGRKIIESHSSQKLRIGKTCRLERRLCLQVFVSRQTLVGSSFLCAAGGVRSQGAVDPGESQLACCHLTSCAVLPSIHFNTPQTFRTQRQSTIYVLSTCHPAALILTSLCKADRSSPLPLSVSWQSPSLGLRWCHFWRPALQRVRP